ncbi:hypothetical protein NDU88_004787 [Pleurodeles waltl]|uniref:Uncharacterized protein n=1 Tax=Pleurodeles waltl TaxID=8319 RepID=A0AAV7NKK3_PLEWA|nr:hypothetical protein NDU88_004787 [Pleurodeles waltl]
MAHQTRREAEKVDREKTAYLPQLKADKGLESHTALLVLGIKDTKEALKLKIETVAHDINLLREGHKKLVDKLAETESALAHTRPTALSHGDRLFQLEKEIALTQRKMDDAEGRTWRNNIRLVGFEIEWKDLQ